MLSELWQLLAAPFALPFDPSRRLYWIFILSALVLASITVACQHGRLDLRAQLASLSSRRYWLHRSTLQDVGWMLLNSMLRVLVLVPLFGTHLAATVAVAGWLQHTLGDAPSLAWPFAAIGLAYTLSFFVLEDVSRFALHFALHKIPWLWRFHRVHHSAEILTPLTLYRVHPLEALLYYARGLAVFGLVSGVFVYLFRNQVHGYDILGVDLLGFLFNLLGANLRHSPIWLSFGRLEAVFVSPAQHQIHHSAAPEHRDTNFGTCLALWDRLAGTWQRAGPPRRLEFGLAARAG